MAGKYFTKSGQSVIGGIDRNGNPKFAKLIYENGALLTIPPELAATFAGKEFFYTEAFTLAGTTDRKDYIFQTPNTDKWAHMNIIRGTGSAITYFKIIEDTELSSTDALTVFNNNRNDSTTNTAELFQVDALGGTTDTGTKIFEINSGGSSNQSRSPMLGSYADEMFLKKDTKYRISFGTGTASNLCNLLLKWHEHENEAG